jgi:hypothetical protein
LVPKDVLTCLGFYLEVGSDVTDLFLDGCSFSYRMNREVVEGLHETNQTHTSLYLLVVVLKEIGASQHQKCVTYQCIHDDEIEVYPVTQKIIMKMVRLYPTLKWLQSDLTAENVAIMPKQERPGITFVTK